MTNYAAIIPRIRHGYNEGRERVQAHADTHGSVVSHQASENSRLLSYRSYS